MKTCPSWAGVKKQMYELKVSAQPDRETFHTANVSLSALVPSCEAPEITSGLSPRGSRGWRQYQDDKGLQSCSFTAFLPLSEFSYLLDSLETIID